MNKTIVTTATISAVAGGIVGGVVTYLSVNKALRNRYQEMAYEEIASVKMRYTVPRSEAAKEEFLENIEKQPSSEDLVRVKSFIQDMGYSEPEAEEEGTHRIFDNAVDLDEKGEPIEESDYDDDESDEHDGKPFLITSEAYFENENGYELDTLTYYAVDETLCDNNDQQIDRVDETIGAWTLHKFDDMVSGRHVDIGKDIVTKGKTSLYVQNDEHETLYEIILVENSYASAVMGVDDETLGIKVPKERPKKMRDDH